MEDWVDDLLHGRLDESWDRFIARYRRVIFSAIRHYLQDHDDVMDVFAWVCESLRADEMRRLRRWAEQTDHRAKPSTWLVTVVRNLTIDWIRSKEGRPRPPAMAEELPPLQRRIFTLVFIEHRSHVEAYELIHSRDVPELTFRQFQAALRATYAAVALKDKFHLLDDPDQPPAPDELADDGSPFADLMRYLPQLERAFRSCPSEDQLLIRLLVVEKLSAKAVAKILGLPNEKAVYNRRYRILTDLRERLEGGDSEMAAG